MGDEGGTRLFSPQIETSVRSAPDMTDNELLRSEVATTKVGARRPFPLQRFTEIDLTLFYVPPLEGDTILALSGSSGLGSRYALSRRAIAFRFSCIAPPIALSPKKALFWECKN